MSYYSDYDDEKKEKEKVSVVQQERGGQASAEGYVIMNAAAYQAFLTGSYGSMSEAWAIARLVGIQGAKKADGHLLVSNTFTIVGIEMEYEADEDSRKVIVRCEVTTRERIGAETAALMGCGMALMSLVNSLRAIDREMTIEGLHVIRN